MTAARVTQNVQLEANAATANTDILGTLNAEMHKLHLAIQQAYAKALQETIQVQAYDEIAVSRAQQDHKARLAVYDRCFAMVKELKWAINSKSSLAMFGRGSLPEAKKTFLEDARLMLETVKLATQLIAEPNQAVNTLLALQKHAKEVTAHLDNVKASTEKKRMWGGILICLGVIVMPLVVTATIIVAAATNALTPLLLVSSMDFTFTAMTGFLLAGGGLISLADHAKKQVDLCNEVRGLRKTNI